MGGFHSRIGMTSCLIAMACAAAPATAQRLSVGLEGGGTSTDDRRGLQPGFGLSLMWPMGDRFAGALSYSQWFPDGPEPPHAPLGTIGKRGLTLSALLRAAQSERILWLIGGGFGQYERIVTIDDVTDRTYDGALTASTIFMVRLTERTATYIKGELSTPTGDWDARWGGIHIGLALPLF